jgi:hypothetical protein
MPEESMELRAIVARLARVERENRSLKRAGVSVLVILGAIFVMGQAQGTKTIDATQFNVRDSRGRIRGVLGTHEGFTFLNLYGPEGVHSAGPSVSDSVMVGNGPEGQYVIFTDAKGKTRLDLVLDRDDKPGLRLYNREAEEIAALTASGNSADLGLGRVGGPEQFEVSVGPDFAPHLVLSDKAGFQTLIGAANVQTPRGETLNSSAATIVLFGKDRHVLWSAP